MIRTATRLISVSLAFAAVAGSASADQIAETSSLLSYVDEIAILAAIIGGLYLLDRSTWSFLTGQRKQAPRETNRTR